jgi:hypothetical protein
LSQAAAAALPKLEKRAGVEEYSILVFGGMSDGEIQNSTLEITITITGLETEDRTGPGDFLLRPNFPNPFNAGTVLSFDLPDPSDCTLTVYDSRGGRIAVLFEGRKNAGNHSVRWDGRNSAGASVPSGVYVARLTVGTAVRSTKMVLIR